MACLRLSVETHCQLPAVARVIETSRRVPVRDEPYCEDHCGDDPSGPRIPNCEFQMPEIERHVERVDVIAWSRGGPRAVGYVAQHPESVRRLVLLAPSYKLAFQTDKSAMSIQSYREFQAN
jgi:hypothetical protein